MKKENINDSIIEKNSRIVDAIETLNKSANKIVLVVDLKGVLLGTITDGDIRRGLLQGMGLESPIEEIVHTEAVTVSETYTDESVLEIMIEKRIEQIPVLDLEGKPVDLLLWSEITGGKVFPNTIFIMAGGKGERLMPLTENCPKPMLVISGKPILEHIILKARKEGFRNFVISIHYLGEMISSYFEDGRKFGVNIEYVKESKPLGTAGSLGLLSDLPLEPIIVTNGDILSEISFKYLLDFHTENQALATMAVGEYAWQNPFGVVELDRNQIKSYTEKPTTISKINAGIYVLQPSAIRYLTAGEHCNMSEFFLKLMSANQNVLACPVREQWLDLGTHNDLKKASGYDSIN